MGTPQSALVFSASRSPARVAAISQQPQSGAIVVTSSGMPPSDNESSQVKPGSPPIGSAAGSQVALPPRPNGPRVSRPTPVPPPRPSAPMAALPPPAAPAPKKEANLQDAPTVPRIGEAT